MVRRLAFLVLSAAMVTEVAIADTLTDSADAPSKVLGDEVVSADDQAHLQFDRWCKSTVFAQKSRRQALQELLSQAKPAAVESPQLQQFTQETALLEASLERQRVALEVADGTHKKELLSAQLDMDDAAKSYDAVQKALARLGGKNVSTAAQSKGLTVLSELLPKIEADVRQEKFKLLKLATNQTGNVQLLHLQTQYQSKMSELEQLRHLQVSSERSMDVLMCAVEDESAYLSDLEGLCNIEAKVHQRLKSSVFPSLEQALARTETVHVESSDVVTQIAPVALPNLAAALRALPALPVPQIDTIPMTQKTQAVQQVVVTISKQVAHPNAPTLPAAPVVQVAPAAPAMPAQAPAQLAPVPQAGSAPPAKHQVANAHSRGKISDTSQAFVKPLASPASPLKVLVQHSLPSRPSATIAPKATASSAPKPTAKKAAAAPPAKQQAADARVKGKISATAQALDKPLVPPASPPKAAAAPPAKQQAADARVKGKISATAQALDKPLVPPASPPKVLVQHALPSRASAAIAPKATAPSAPSSAAKVLVQPALPSRPSATIDPKASAPPAPKSASKKAAATPPPAKSAPEDFDEEADSDFDSTSTFFDRPSSPASLAQEATRMPGKRQKHLRAARTGQHPPTPSAVAPSRSSAPAAALTETSQAASEKSAADEDLSAVLNSAKAKARTKRSGKAAKEKAFMNDVYDSAAGNMPTQYTAWTPDAGGKPSASTASSAQKTPASGLDDDDLTSPALAVSADQSASPSHQSAPTMKADSHTFKGADAALDHVSFSGAQTSKKAHQSAVAGDTPMIKPVITLSMIGVPQQYAAWTPSSSSKNAAADKKALVAQMSAAFDSDDDDDASPAPPQASGKQLQLQQRHSAAPAPSSRRSATATPAYDDDDLPKNPRSSFSDLQGGWQAMMKTGAVQKKVKALKQDKDVEIMQSLYTSDGGLPSQYTAWSPTASSPPKPVVSQAPPAYVQKEAPDTSSASASASDFASAAKDFEKDDSDSFLQLGASASSLLSESHLARLLKQASAPEMRGPISFIEETSSMWSTDVSTINAANVVLEAFADELQSQPLRQLSRANLTAPKLQVLLEQLRVVDPLTHTALSSGKGKQAQATQWCEYFESNVQATSPLHTALVNLEKAKGGVTQVTSQRAALMEEIDARTQLLKTIEQDAKSFSVLLQSAQQAHDTTLLEAAESQLASSPQGLGSSASAFLSSYKTLVHAVDGVSAAQTELADAVETVQKRRDDVVQEHKMKLKLLQSASKVAESACGLAATKASQAELAVATARRSLTGLQLSCDKALGALAQHRHAGHMEMKAIELALSVLRR